LAIIAPNVTCFGFALTTFPPTNFAGPAFSTFPKNFFSSCAALGLGLSNTILLPGVQYPFPFDKLHPSHTNSPRYPPENPDGIWNEEAREGGDGRLSGREGPAPFVEEGSSIETISLSWDFTDLWPLAWPFAGGERDRDGFKGVLEASGWVGEGIRFSATVVGLMSSMISRSSSESEEGKKRSGSLFERVGAAGDGEGEKSMTGMSNLSMERPTALLTL